MDASEIPDGLKTLPAHETCRHKGYRLTCAQYEALVTESEGLCMACAVPAAKTRLGKLVIDHDYGHGDWAVRGLICSGCNALFVRGSQGPYWAQPFLTDPWFERELARHGKTPKLPPEPAPDAYIKDTEGHIWFVDDGLWRWSWNTSPQHTWAQLFYRFGPLGLTPTTRSDFESARGFKSHVRRQHCLGKEK